MTRLIPDEARTVLIRALLNAPFITHGSVQGVVHAWHPGSDPQFFTLRSLQNNALIHCEYSSAMYHEVHLMTQEEHAVAIVTGDVFWDRATNSIVRVVLTTAPTVSRPLTQSEFDRIFGSAPEFTGTMTTDEYIDWVRGDGD